MTHFNLMINYYWVAGSVYSFLWLVREEMLAVQDEKANS